MNRMDFMRKFLENPKSKQYLIVFFLCGVLLMFVPVKNSENSAEQKSESVISIEREEKRMENFLSNIEGVGKCNVLFSASEEQELIASESDKAKEYISISNNQEISYLKSYLRYEGAVIVCGGCDDVNVRYDVLSAVMAYTGLGADKITICPIAQ